MMVIVPPLLKARAAARWRRTGLEGAIMHTAWQDISMFCVLAFGLNPSRFCIIHTRLAH